MARYEVTCDRFRPSRYPGKDAQAITVTVTKDGDHLVWVRVVASDKSLLGVDIDPGQFWAHLARAAMPLIEDAIKHGEIPNSDGGEPPLVQPPVQAVVAAARSGPALPPLAEGDDLGAFSL